MRTLKIIVVSVVFCCSISHAQSGSLPHSPVTVISNYKTEMKAPFFSKAGQWVFWGLAPDYFTLYESINPDDSFSIVLMDDENAKWVEFYSDTLKHSVVNLPDEATKNMASDGIKFIGSLLKMFADTGQHYLKGRVTLGDSSLYASAAELESSIPDTRRFWVRTYDDHDTYIDGEVLIEYKNGIVTYREIDVFVEKSKLKLKLVLLNSRIE